MIQPAIDNSTATNIPRGRPRERTVRDSHREAFIELKRRIRGSPSGDADPDGSSRHQYEGSQPSDGGDRSERSSFRRWMAALVIAFRGYATESWGYSAMLHLGLIAALAAFARPVHEPGVSLALDSSVGTGWGDSDEPDGGSDVRAGGMPAGTATLILTSGAAMTDASQLMQSGGTDDIDIEDYLLSGGGSGGDGTGGGAGDGRGTGGGGKGDGTIAFFGSESRGRRFVFLIDCSTSMEGERFARARHELIRTLQQLSEDQEFYVIFFSDRTIPLYDPHPVRVPVKATKIQKNKARRWISNRHVVGGTFPEEGLRMALAMKPDVVYFLSDGEFPGSARRAAADANRSGTVIHTIGFGYQAGEAQLRAIAEDHKGRYQFVP